MEGLVFSAWRLTTALDLLLWNLLLGQAAHQVWCWTHGQRLHTKTQLWVRNIHHGTSQQQHHCRAGSHSAPFACSRSGFLHLHSEQGFGGQSLLDPSEGDIQHYLPSQRVGSRGALQGSIRNALCSTPRWREAEDGEVSLTHSTPLAHLNIFLIFSVPSPCIFYALAQETR